MSAVSFNLANYRQLSQQSGRSNSSKGSNSKKVTNQRLEPLKSQRNVAPIENIVLPNVSATTRNNPVIATTDSKEQVRTKVGNQMIGTKNPTNLINGDPVEYTQSIQYKDNKTLHLTGTNAGKTFLTNSHVPADEEAEYFENVRRLDECGHCWAGQQKYATQPFKLMQKNPTQTLYQKDYIKHPLEGKQPKVNNDFYGTFHIEEPMDLATTMRKDYVPHNVAVPKRITMEGKSSATGVPFAGRSGYKAEYINWGKQPVTIERPPNNVTVISELPFSSKTAYNENFGPIKEYDQAKPVDRDLWKTKKSPLSPGIPFMDKTSYKQTFKPHELYKVPSFPIIDDFQPDEAYPGQYASTYKQDYTKPTKWKCPAKTFMETHPHPKEKYLML